MVFLCIVIWRRFYGQQGTEKGAEGTAEIEQAEERSPEREESFQRKQVSLRSLSSKRALVEVAREYFQVTSTRVARVTFIYFSSFPLSHYSPSIRYHSKRQTIRHLNTNK
jgi:hypothetical protein